MEVAGLLARLLFEAFPSRFSRNSGICSSKSIFQAYSCGYSSGFTPDSHVRPCRPEVDFGTISGGKSRDFYHRLNREALIKNPKYSYRSDNLCYPWCKNIILTQISPTNTTHVKKFSKQVFLKSESVNIRGFVPM